MKLSLAARAPGQGHCKPRPGFMRIRRWWLLWEAALKEQGSVIRWYLLENEEEVHLPLGRVYTRAHGWCMKPELDFGLRRPFRQVPCAELTMVHCRGWFGV